MNDGRVTILATYAAYMVGLICIGLWADRRYGRTYKGFLSADSSLGAWVSAVSAAASSESAWVMLGLSGLGYTKGLAAYWASLGCVLGFICSSLWVIRQIRRDAGRLGAITVTDYIEARLGDDLRLLRTISAAVIIFFMMCYVVAQFVGAGKQMEGMGLMSYGTGVVLGALIIGVYVVLGGYAAVCWTDLIQGLLMAAVTLIFPLIAISKVGGLAVAAAALKQEGLGWLPGAEGLTWAAIGFIVGQLGIGIGYPGMPHFVLRFITIKGDREARNAAFITVGWSLVVLFGAATLGILGRILLPDLADPEHVLPAFTKAFLHPVVAGVVLAAITAAIMSTADSQLMISATAAIHDLWYRLRREAKPAGRQMIVLTRAVIGAMALTAMLLALIEPRVIFTFVLFAWGALGAAFTPVILLCLYWRRFNRWGALASFIVGPVTVLVWKLVPGLSDKLYEMVPAAALSTLAAVAVTLATSDRITWQGANPSDWK